ncbi:CbbBc protein, partial [Acinetobacter baumannii]
ERALIRFAEPQDMVQMATFGSTEITSEFVHIRIGGDLALIKGMMKVMFEREAQGERVLDHAFLAEHTVGLEPLREDVMAQDWDQIVQ